MLTVSGISPTTNCYRRVHETGGHVVWWRDVTMAWNSLHNSVLLANHIGNAVNKGKPRRVVMDVCNRFVDTECV